MTERTAEGLVGDPAAVAPAATDGPAAPDPGSGPDQAELGAYAHLLPEDRRSAAVLGTTPQLRALAIAQFDAVVTVTDDDRPVPVVADPREQETVVRAGWTELGDALAAPVAAVLGDLVVGRLDSVEEVLALLHAVRAALAPRGAFVTRTVVVPEGMRLRDVELPTVPALVLPERRWLDLTADAGFATTRLRLSGQPWNVVAPLYALEVRP